MKKSILSIMALVLLSTTVEAQRGNREPAPFDLIFGIGIDPKMAIQGPHKGQEGNQPSLDYTIAFGFDWQHVRGQMKLKSHKEINFFKWTYLAFDYKYDTPLIDGLVLYGGLEAGQIRRTHPDYLDPNAAEYRRVTINPLNFGANFEAQYKFMNDRFSAGVLFNIYQSEDELKPYKKFRKDVSVMIYFYL